MPRSRKLPRRISEEAKSVLGVIYKHFNESGSWIGSKTLRLKFGADTIDALSKKYEPALFKRRAIGPGDHYELSIWGLMNSDGTDHDQKLICSFLECLRDEYKQDPERQFMKSSEIRQKLALDQKDLDKLKNYVGILYFGYSDSFPTPEWVIQMPQGFEQYVERLSTRDYLLTLIENRYKADVISTGKFRLRETAIQLGFWALVVTQAWTLSVILIGHSRIPRFSIVTASAWLTLFALSNILQLLQIHNQFVQPQKFVEKLIWYGITITISLLAAWLV